MFEPDSRYYDLEDATMELPDGREVVYKRRRLIARRRGTMIGGRVIVQREDRVDHIAARTIGDPGQYWRILDANGVMNPREIDEGEGQILDIPVAGTESL
jgi:hypothetical protein